MTAAQSFPVLKTQVRAAEPVTEASPGHGHGKMAVENLTVRYGQRVAINGVTMPFHTNHITASIGPSGCGKSTLLRALNRMNDEFPKITSAPAA